MTAPVIPTEVDEKEKGDKKPLNLSVIFENHKEGQKGSPQLKGRNLRHKEILGFNMKRVDLLHQLNQKAIHDLKYYFEICFNWID
jgi:hypothetical protein